MSTDLERRLHDELHARAQDAGAWRQGGAVLRRTAAVHRARRLRAAAVVGVAAATVAVVAGLGLAGGRPDAAPPAGPTSTPTSAPRELLQVPVPASVIGAARDDLALGKATLLATATLPRSGDTMLVFRDQWSGADNRIVVNTVTAHHGQVVAGTVAYYRPDDDVMAQPARDGTGTTLVVVAPVDVDSVEVTTSLPGKDIRTRTAPVDRGIALVPVVAPDAVTRLRLMHDGATVRDVIPGSFHLGPDVPSPLSRVIVSTGGTQPVQVRTDGKVACRLTVARLSPPDAFVQEWDPFDQACQPIDRSTLQLLLAADRRYSSVAGVAPPGTGLVRLHWRNGDVTDVPVADDEVPAFVDTSGHRPDHLTLAQAISTAGDETARAEP